MEPRDVKEVKEGKQTRGGPVRNYTALLLSKQAYRLAMEVSKLTRAFPRHEQFELGRQLRCGSRSVAVNIVGPWAKRNLADEFNRHLIIASGECAETKFWIELAGDEGRASKQHCRPLVAEYSKPGMMIHNLWKE